MCFGKMQEGDFFMRGQHVFKLTRTAILAAIATILFYIEVPVGVPFYKLDFSTLPSILAGFAMGPLYGLATVAIKDLLHLLTSTSGGIGQLADFLMSGSLVVVSSLIYQRHKTRARALIGLCVGTLVMAALGALVNYYIMLPFYTAFMPMEEIIAAGTALIPAIDSQFKFVLLITAPFNLFKGVVLSAATFLLYKRVSPLLHAKH